MTIIDWPQVRERFEAPHPVTEALISAMWREWREGHEPDAEFLPIDMFRTGFLLAEMLMSGRFEESARKDHP